MVCYTWNANDPGAQTVRPGLAWPVSTVLQGEDLTGRFGSPITFLLADSPETASNDTGGAATPRITVPGPRQIQILVVEESSPFLRFSVTVGELRSGILIAGAER
jgi:hypothetical protein